MSAIAEIAHLNKVKYGDFKLAMKILFQSFTVESENPTEQVLLESKEQFVVDFQTLMEKYLQSPYVSSRKYKLVIIDFIDQLNSQRELIELLKSGISPDDLKIAAQRLGDKSQSTFSSKKTDKKTKNISKQI
jgi:hypothetical protein